MLFDRINGLIGEDIIREIKEEAARYYEFLKRMGAKK